MERLIKAALVARHNSYSPYSGFAVGAAVRTKTGEIFAGCNVENAVYGLAICAERVALAHAVAAGHREFDALAIAADPLATPCGSCRQFIAEFGGDIQIVCVDVQDPTKRHQFLARDLLPDAFHLDRRKSNAR